VFIYLPPQLYTNGELCSTECIRPATSGVASDLKLLLLLLLAPVSRKSDYSFFFLFNILASTGTCFFRTQRQSTTSERHDQLRFPVDSFSSRHRKFQVGYTALSLMQIALDHLPGDQRYRWSPGDLPCWLTV
jgi:hypothetical protein